MDGAGKNCTARDLEDAERRAGLWMGLGSIAPREIGRTQRGGRALDGAGKKVAVRSPNAGRVGHATHTARPEPRNHGILARDVNFF
jgi:hypothetical protein